MPAEDAIAELRRCEGAQFDPAVVEAVLAAVRRQADGRSPANPALTDCLTPIPAEGVR
jgi:HD-GYP domain-containing protein (c-di-GMP phosphodiesterase class II)